MGRCFSPRIVRTDCATRVALLIRRSQHCGAEPALSAPAPMELWAIHSTSPIRSHCGCSIGSLWHILGESPDGMPATVVRSPRSITPQRKPFADGAFSVVRVLSGQELIALSIAPCTVETYGRAWR